MAPTGGSAADAIVIDDSEPEETHQQAGSSTDPIVIIDSDGDEGVTPLPENWPLQLPYWTRNRNPWDVQFMDMDLGMCECTRECTAEACDNAKCAIICDETNCGVGSKCGNRLHNRNSLVLIRCIKGMGIMTTVDIPKGTIVGEYCGLIIPQNKLTVNQVNRGFTLQFKSKCNDAGPACIDAHPGGSLCRYVNHSCSPNSKFEERAQRTTRRMEITTKRNIKAGDEITVKYNKDVSFECLCGEIACTSRRK